MMGVVSVLEIHASTLELMRAGKRLFFVALSEQQHLILWGERR
jgi:hypothetical protein